MGAAPVLKVLRDGQMIKSCQIEGEAMLGRSENCVIRIDDRVVSRQHVLFKVLSPDSIQIERKSEFGTVNVNGKECTSAVIKEGDLVAIGPYLIEISAGEPKTTPTQGEANAATAPESPGSGINEQINKQADEGGVFILNESVVSLETSQPEKKENEASDKTGLANVPELFSDNILREEKSNANGVFDEDAATKIAKKPEFAAKLSFPRGSANVEEYEIAKDEIVIGRGKDCDIVLNDKKASRAHATIRREGSGHVLKDLGSANGVLLNGEKIDGKAWLTGNDLITIGNVGFRFQMISREFVAKQNEFSVTDEEASVDSDIFANLAEQNSSSQIASPGIPAI
ncbi:MAG: FHA domain-containing protein, partial [Bdellovibrionota bacterium]